MSPLPDEEPIVAGRGYGLSALGDDAQAVTGKKSEAVRSSLSLTKSPKIAWRKRNPGKETDSSFKF
jgi:hypothetical protein